MDGEHYILRKFLNNMIKLGSRLCDLSISESSLCMKEPEIVVFGPKILEFNGHLGDILLGGWSSEFFRHFHRGSRLKVQIW